MPWKTATRLRLNEGIMPAVRTLPDELLIGIAPGTWVAISEGQDRIIATADSIDALLKKSRENGVPNPFVIRVPDNSALIL
jgi:hypothetical protein